MCFAQSSPLPQLLLLSTPLAAAANHEQSMRLHLACEALAVGACSLWTHRPTLHALRERQRRLLLQAGPWAAQTSVQGTACLGQPSLNAPIYTLQPT